MSEFDWRNRLRALQHPIEPVHDLWPEISARITALAATPPHRRRDGVGWGKRSLAALAATLLIAVGAGVTSYRLQTKPALPRVALVADGSDAAVPRTALDWAVPHDPQLARAARDLDDASSGLQTALEAHPDAVFLVSMLNRTNSQRMRLMRQAAISG